MISRSSKRYVLIVVAVLIAATVLFVALHGASQQRDPAEAARANFIATCKEQGRIANGGGTSLRMDDTTEEGLDLYCGCVADHFDQALNPAEVRAVGDGTASKDVLAKLNAVVSTCQAEHLTPTPDSGAGSSGTSGSNSGQ